MASNDKGSTLAKWRRKVTANVKSRKRTLNSVEEENRVGKEKKMDQIVEQRQAFSMLDNKQSTDATDYGRKNLRASKTCAEQERRRVGVVYPHQATTRSEPMSEIVSEKEHLQGNFSKDVVVDIPTKRSKRGRGPPFSIPVPRPTTVTDHAMDLNDLGREIDTLRVLPENVEDIDKGETDIFMHPEYHSDIINFLIEIERKYAHPDIDFLEQREVSPNMRKILVDWLIQVQVHLRLLDETLHLSVTLLDRFVSRTAIALRKFQLLGITCLFVSAKYTERFAPVIEDLVHLTDNTYSFQEVIDMELVVLNTLKFDLSFACPYHFLERYLKAANCHKNMMMRFMCMYLLDLSLIDARCIPFKPTMIAAAALCLVRQILNENFTEASWTPSLVYYSCYRKNELMPCIRRIAKALCMIGQSKYKAAQEKYSSEAYYGVSRSEILVTSPILRRIATDEL